MADRILIVPDGLVPDLERLIQKHAELTGEQPSACARGVEISVLIRGMAGLRLELERRESESRGRESA